jgi:hypothetical protein
LVFPSSSSWQTIVGATSSEGIKFSGGLPATGKTPVDLAAILKSFSSNPANKVSDVSRNSKDDPDNLLFSVANSATTAHFRHIRMKGALYILTIDTPMRIATWWRKRKINSSDPLNSRGSPDRAE